MFDNKGAGYLSELLKGIKRYLLFSAEYAKLSVVAQLTKLLSVLILIIVLIIGGTITLFYLSFSLASILEPLTGGRASAFAVVAGTWFLLIIIIVTFRNALIVRPLFRFLARLLLD
ncbi:hypothetical protein EZS27_019721 [termite gut metagenome]|jgi:hypothetical protein|uniref:Phage holin family protein n=1 Tax=termite gut metagenome TaxID=433724 RepID=A0A5J4RFM6_9ZZZZ